MLRSSDILFLHSLNYSERLPLQELHAISTLVQIVENAPWLQSAGKTIHRYDQGEWKEIARSDLETLGVIEAQVCNLELGKRVMLG